MKSQEMKIDAVKLKSKRQAKGWTQQHLADVSGISLRTIQRAEMDDSVSTETINALSAVFEMNHHDWLLPEKPELNHKQVFSRGWKVALIAVAMTQLMALIITWLFVGEVSTLWLKLLLIVWLILGLITAITWVTCKIQKVNTYAELSQLKKQFKDTQSK